MKIFIAFMNLLNILTSVIDVGMMGWLLLVMEGKRIEEGD